MENDYFSLYIMRAFYTFQIIFVMFKTFVVY